MSVTSVSTTSSVAQSSLLSTDQKAQAMAAKMVKEFDSNGDGSLDQNEFVTGMVSKGMSKTDATNLFNSIDSKKTGKITTSDLAAAIKSGKLKPSGTKQDSSSSASAGTSTRAASSGGGSASAGGAKAGGGGGGGGASSTQYDPADTNKDGVVEPAEEVAYEQKHPLAAARKAEASAATEATTATTAATTVSTVTAQKTLGTNVDELV